MFSQKSLQENEKKSLKRALNGMEFICGTSFQEFVRDTKNKDINGLDKAFARENLSYMSIVQMPYFSCDFLKKFVFTMVQSAIRKGVRKRKMC